jgi:pimeloyl-ACP methyl ester carboxylesterase
MDPAQGRLLAALAAAVVGAQACGFFHVREQQAKIDALCSIEGSVRVDDGGQAPLVVLLARLTGEDPARRDSWQLADHFVLERAGRWAFAAGTGRYALAAFADLNGDLVYQPSEPFLRLDPAQSLTCTAGQSFRELSLVVPARGRQRDSDTLDVAKLQARTVQDQLSTTLGQVTAVGETATLSDARFSEANAENGLWRPFDFLFDARAGVYFLQPYDAKKVPVLFVHGINGTPRNFETLIARLDRSRFQPWVYYYPSGAHLDAVADHLAQTIGKLQLRYDFDELPVVAHSMGGLVARGFLQRYGAAGGRARTPLFISLSTPWSGHRAAEIGVRTSPVVVRVWEDMAPGSQYLSTLFAPTSPLPAGTAYHMFFTINDQTVAPASQLRREAQREAVRIYGFDESHMGVLGNAEVSVLINALLAKAAP